MNSPRPERAVARLAARTLRHINPLVLGENSTD